MIDLDRLSDDERRVWDEMFPGGFEAHINEQNRPAFALWSFGYWCNFALDGCPDVVTEKLEELDANNNAPLTYMRARREGRPPR